MSETNIDFDCEFYRVQRVEEGELTADRRTTQSVIYHFCTFYGDEQPDRRCNLKKCPKIDPDS